MGINLPPHSIYVQSFIARSTLLPKILFDEEKCCLQSAALPVSHQLSQLAQFDTAISLDRTKCVE